MRREEWQRGLRILRPLIFSEWVLGSSRGSQNIGEMVDTLERMNIGALFTIGGDGTLRGAQAISEEVRRRGLKISVVGIPKTIDNDISYVQMSFGFDTAVSEARRVTYAAHSEAEGARNGIGLVKLMGRESGFITAYAAMAGRTEMAVSFWRNELTHVPIPMAVFRRKKIDPHGALWNAVISCTGQPKDLA